MIKANSLQMPIKDKSVQSIITSPPYWGLRKYDIPDIELGGWCGQLGLEPTPELYIKHLMLVMAECWRVLKDDGVCFVNLGDTYAGSGGAGGDYNKGGLREGQTKYRQAKIKLKPKSLCLIPEQFIINCQQADWVIRNTIIWHKPNAMPSSVKDRFTVTHEKVFFLTKQGKYYFDLAAVRLTVKIPPKPDISPVPENRKEKWIDVPGQRTTGFMRKGHSGYYDKEGRLLINPKGKNPGSVWEIPTQPYPEAHYATFPEKLVERLLLCSTKPGDVILDPFLGSETVEKAAIKFGRKPIGFDLGYQELQAKRTNNVQINLLAHQRGDQ